MLERPVDFSDTFFVLFQHLSECASLPPGEDREAGINPALPRNCKRGNCGWPPGTIPGRPDTNPDAHGILTRKARRPEQSVHLNPFRVKRRMVMRAFRVAVFVFGLVFVFVSGAAASAANLKVKVIDPQSAAVVDAQVLLLRAGEAAVLSAQSTSAEGTVIFRASDSGKYQIKVLAPGFAVQVADVPARAEEVSIQLRLATASETVVVSATRTPVPGEAAGADVDTLNNEQLTVMQPVAADDGVRFLPGAVVNTAGQRGGLSSLFVRGGDSTYNKVIVDGVTINEPGGTFDFGTLPLTEGSRMEFVRGAQSTLYGSDAMTSVVQVWTRTGSTPIPEFRFGADGGNFGTANGYASLAGARGRFDYNVFGSQYYTNGQGINDFYSDSLQGANIGMAINNDVALRVRLRHSNSHTGIPGEWDFNGDPLQPPDPSEWSQYNNVLGSVELAVAEPSGWQHHFTAFDYLYRYNELNEKRGRGCTAVFF